MGLENIVTGDIILDRYEILGELGRGGTAKVYRAKDNLRDDEVALKILHSDLEFAKREVSALHKITKLNNSNVVQIYDARIHEDYLIISEEIVEGKTLFDFVKFYKLKKNKEFSENIKLDLIYQIANGLLGIHDCELIHRDLNPWNIIVSYTSNMDDSYIELKIIDLGKSADVDEIRNSLGSGFFASPEQYLKEINPEVEVDYRSDIHTAGVLFYYIETGDFPFHDYFEAGEIHPFYEDVSRSMCRLKSTKGMVKEKNLCFDKIIKKCLEQRPADRYQEAIELLTDIIIEIKKRKPEGDSQDDNILGELKDALDSLEEIKKEIKPVIEKLKDCGEE